MHLLRPVLSVCLLAAFGLTSGDCVAAGAKNLMQGIPTTDELVEALSPPPQFRGITAKPMTELEEEPPAADLAVNFEFDSASLTPTARQILDNLAAAMTSDLDAFRFVLEGHTDASGSERYNQTLSERRAAAVRAYLVEQHHLDESRLVAVGKGENDLLDPADPEAGVNRRVRVINLGVSG